MLLSTQVAAGSPAPLVLFPAFFNSYNEKPQCEHHRRPHASRLGTLGFDPRTVVDALDFDLAAALDFHLAISAAVCLKVLVVDFSLASVDPLLASVDPLLLERRSSHPCRCMYHPTKLSLSTFAGVITILFAATINPALLKDRSLAAVDACKTTTKKQQVN